MPVLRFRPLVLPLGSIAFDLAVLWQAGFRNTTCAIGTQLTPAQLAQLADQPGRAVYIVFDQDGGTGRVRNNESVEPHGFGVSDSGQDGGEKTEFVSLLASSRTAHCVANRIQQHAGLRGGR